MLSSNLSLQQCSLITDASVCAIAENSKSITNLYLDFHLGDQLGLSNPVDAMVLATWLQVKEEPQLQSTRIEAASATSVKCKVALSRTVV